MIAPAFEVNGKISGLVPFRTLGGLIERARFGG